MNPVQAALTAMLTGLAMLTVVTAANASLFEEEEVLRIELGGPLDDLVDHMEDKRTFPFSLRVNGMEHPVSLSPRGNSRLQICEFPPLRLEFPEPTPADNPFSGLERVKLVTHCRDVRNMEMNVLEEYAAYRIFNELTPIGYRVRRLEIRYVDTESGSSSTHPAFAIEPTDQLAERLGAEELELPGVYLSRFDKEHLALVSVYQYVIGNTDWSLVAAEGGEVCCHNGKVLDLDGALYLIPYDYDRTGLVDASYAKPARSARIRKVTQRRYRGYCNDDEAELLEAIDRTLASRTAIEAILSDLPELDDKDREKALRFLEKYFESASDREKLRDEFVQGCLG